MNPLERLTKWRRSAGNEGAFGGRIDEKTGEILPSGSADEAPTRSTVEPTHIAGDRHIPSVNRERSLRTLVGRTLALATLGLLTAGVLAWYYSSQWGRVHDARVAERQATEARSAGESRVPPLGRIDPPQQPMRTAVLAAPSLPAELFPPPPPPPAFVGLAPQAPAGPPPKTPQQLALERKLGAPVLLHARQPEPARGSEPRMMPTGADANSAATPLAASLRPSVTQPVAAQVLPTRRLLLPKGAFIDCTLETAIDSTYDGMVTCIGAGDVYGADGKVVLLERGTKYVGEKRGEVKQGQGRVFVLWNEARTPTGVVVQLASPGTDELGRAGLPGAVDTHFWDRFGAALLISVIDGTVQALAGSQQRGTVNSAVVLNPQTGRDVLTEVLKSTIAIPPTVVKNQGDRIQVLVARDVDFRAVYALHGDDGQR